MLNRRRALPTLFLLVLGSLPATAANPADEIVAGQSLADALRLLSARHGLATVFTAELVPQRLTIVAPPKTTDAVGLRTALLAQHGLRCREVHARCVVERTPDPAAPVEDPEPQAARLPEVQVGPSHYALASEGASFLSAEDIAATPHLADDVFRLARSIPGVTGGDISAPFHVRGGNTDEVALRLDGLELYKPFHLHNLQNALGIIDSNLIGGIDVYTGAWPSRFGGRTSAVVDIRSREPSMDRERRLGLSAINAFYTHGNSSDDGERSLLASARRGYLDVVLNFVDPGGIVDPGYYDVFGRYQQQLGDAHRVSVNVLRAGDDIVYADEDGQRRSDGSSAANYLWLGWRADWSDRWSSETLLAYTRLDRERIGFSFDPFDTNAIMRDVRDVSGLRLSHQHLWQWNERTAVEAGLEWRDERSDYDYHNRVENFSLFSRQLQRYSRDFQFDAEGSQIASWLDLQTALSQRWQLRGGIRATRYRADERDDNTIDPHLALAFQPRERTGLRLGIARTSQFQRSDELAVEDGDPIFYAPERATLMVLGWEEQLTPQISLRAELFDKRWTDLRPRFENLFEPIELFPETEGDRIRVAPQRANSRGLELGLDGRTEAGRWWLRYVWSRARERIDGDWQPRSWDQPHALHAGWDHRFGNGWRLTTEVDAHSGWPTTPVSITSRAGPIEAQLGPRNSDRFDYYLSLSARLSREWALSNSRLVAYFEVFNLLNRENGNLVEEFNLVRDADGNLQVSREYGGGLPVLPSFGVVWHF